MESISKEGTVIDQIAPHPLIYCTKYLPRGARLTFPIINDLNLNSKKWIDELQVFKGTRLSELYFELIRLRKITRMEEFIKGVDTIKFIHFWLGTDQDKKEANAHLDSIEKIIHKSVEQNLELRIHL